MKGKQFKISHKWLFFIGLFLFSGLNLFGQNVLQDLPTTKSWRNFLLDSTNAEEIIKLLGKPVKDKIEKSENSLNKNSDNQKKIRKISYKKIDNYDSVEFIFADNLLVGMNFLLRQNKLKGLAYDVSSLLPAKDLSKAFDKDFLIIYGLPKNSKLSDFEGQKETTVPKVYKQFYSLLNVNKDSGILVSVDNNNFKSGIKEVFGKPTVEVFPGFVQRIQIFSRTMIK
ncbi:MAG TPA: hypothetical protein VNB22_11770 [Pyrinomonadaceae bacterium]|jgi:hypothetical protein|nr:hypothetical protein [Pyrinomonadaceae bacterium]